MVISIHMSVYTSMQAHMSIHMSAHRHVPSFSAEGTDDLRKIAGALGYVGWYKCPNGHLYAIGECTQAYTYGRCPECGETVGGANHVAASGNRKVGIGADEAFQAAPDRLGYVHDEPYSRAARIGVDQQAVL